MYRLIKIIGVIGFLAMAFNVNAARDTAKERKFEELRTKILIEKLALTDKEQKEFFPLYKEYKDKEKVLNSKIRKTHKAAQKEAVTEEEAEKLLKKLKNLTQQKATLFKTYADKFNAVIPAKKVLKLYVVEREINRIIRNKIKERRGSNGKNYLPKSNHSR